MPFDSICMEILKWFNIYSTASENVLRFFFTVLMKVNWHSSLSLTETCPPPLVSSARTSSNTRVTSEKYLRFQSLCQVFLQQRNLHRVVHILLQFENCSKKRVVVVVAALLASVLGSVLHKQRNLKNMSDLLSSSLLVVHKVFLWTDYTSMSTLSFTNLPLLVRRLAPASSSSSLFRSSTSQDKDLGPVELARFGSVLPGWEFSFSWGFQLPSQSKTDWGSSEIALSFIVFFQPAKDFNSRSTVHLQPRTGKVMQKVGPASGKIVLKKRAAVVVAALLNVFSTHVQFSKNIGK